MSKSIFGTITIENSDAVWLEKCDRLAYDKAGRVLLMSIVADSMKIKGIRALLGGEKRVSMQAKGIKGRRATLDIYDRPMDARLTRIEGSYRTEYNKLDYGLTHAFFITRHPGFLLSVTDEHLWLAISQTSFTTPLLREWTPYIRKEFASSGLLEEAMCYRCSCGLLTATTKDLDGIVSEGLKYGKIRIPSSRIVG